MQIDQYVDAKLLTNDAHDLVTWLPIFLNVDGMNRVHGAHFLEVFRREVQVLESLEKENQGEPDDNKILFSMSFSLSPGNLC